MNEITPETLASWRALADSAAPGPWRSAEQTHGQWYGIQSEHLALGNAFEYTDAAFIAAARTAVPALLAEVERLTAERDEALRINEQIHALNRSLVARAVDAEANLAASMEAHAVTAGEVARLEAEATAREAWMTEHFAEWQRMHGAAAAEVARLREGIEALIAEPEFHIDVALGGSDYVRTRLRALLSDGDR